MLAEPWHLRLAMFAGLAAHKLLWEVLKYPRPRSTPSSGRPSIGATAVKIVKLGVLAFLILQTLFLDVLPITTEPRLLRLVGFVVFIVGVTLAMTARVQLGRNWANLEDRSVVPDHALVDTGIYAYIRHPIYTGDVLLLIGLELALNSWLVLAVAPIAAFVVRQVLAEEALLTHAFPAYAEYTTRTKRFIPLIV